MFSFKCRPFSLIESIPDSDCVISLSVVNVRSKMKNWLNQHKFRARIVHTIWCGWYRIFCQYYRSNSFHCITVRVKLEYKVHSISMLTRLIVAITTVSLVGESAFFWVLLASRQVEIHNERIRLHSELNRDTLNSRSFHWFESASGNVNTAVISHADKLIFYRVWKVQVMLHVCCLITK